MPRNACPGEVSQARCVDAWRTTEQGGTVKVIHGPNVGLLDAAGYRVADVQAALVDAFNVPAHALALVDGDPVEKEFLLPEGVTLEFVVPWGVKGALSPEQFRVLQRLEARAGSIDRRLERLVEHAEHLKPLERDIVRVLVNSDRALTAKAIANRLQKKNDATLRTRLAALVQRKILKKDKGYSL